MRCPPLLKVFTTLYHWFSFRLCFKLKSEFFYFFNSETKHNLQLRNHINIVIHWLISWKHILSLSIKVTVTFYTSFYFINTDLYVFRVDVPCLSILRNDVPAIPKHQCNKDSASFIKNVDTCVLISDYLPFIPSKLWFAYKQLHQKTYVLHFQI